MAFLSFSEYLGVLHQARIIPAIRDMGEQRKMALFHREYLGELHDRGELFPSDGASASASSHRHFHLSAHLQSGASASPRGVRRHLATYIEDGRWDYIHDACFRLLPDGLVRAYALDQLVRVVTLEESLTPPRRKPLPVLRFVSGGLPLPLDSARLGAELLATIRPRSIQIVVLS